MADPITPLDARKALKTLTDSIAGLETQLADLTVRERELSAQNRGLQIRENDARIKLGAAEQCCKQQTEKVKELEPLAKDLTRRLAEELARADLADAKAAELTHKADSYDKLLGDALKLLEAFDRLPLKLKDGHGIPSDVQQEIWLYGTYEWKAVADAKLQLERMTDDQ